MSAQFVMHFKMNDYYKLQQYEKFYFKEKGYPQTQVALYNQDLIVNKNIPV